MSGALRQQIIGSQDPRKHDFLSKQPVFQELVPEQVPEISEDIKENSAENVKI
jgi:hypothetical protein